MIQVRTLPMRVAPIPGEALDSWLEALAHRNNVRWRDILLAVGLLPARFGVFDPITALRSEHATAISTASGVPIETLHAMTLHHYQRIWLRTARVEGTVNIRFPWSSMRGSRYCPKCLAESGGRWQLQWRLAWTFACPKHHCLLADLCPRCEGLQRLLAFPALLSPTPGLCFRNTEGAYQHWQTRCGADLSRTVTPSLDRGHPMMKAQSIINDIVVSGTANFGIYRKDPQPSAYAFGDIRHRAAHLLATSRPAAIVQAAGLEVLGVTYDARSARIRSLREHRRTQKQWTATPHAAITAIGITAAIGALSTRPVHPEPLTPRHGRTPPPAAELTALGIPMNPSDELRHRTHPDSTQSRRFPSTRIDDMVHRTPSMLWPEWAVRFALPDHGQRIVQAALSVVLLLVDTPLTLADITGQLDSPVDRATVSRILQKLSNRTDWPDTRIALGRLADYLADHATPIDYQRRRRLDYTNFLPQQVWARICRDTSDRAPRLAQTRVARCYLYERLSGLPMECGPGVRVDTVLRTRVADYPARLTAERALAAEQYCQEFLADNNVSDEPPFWAPPTDVFQGLHLPGFDPAQVEVSALHRLLEARPRGLRSVADELGTTPDVVRLLGQSHPLSIRPPASPQEARTRGSGWRKARAAVSPEDLRRMYHDERRSLRKISDDVGVGRATITALAREYGVAIRNGGAPVRCSVDRDWLYQKYVVEHRSFADIGAEFGRDEKALARRARAFGIPVRRAGSTSHHAYFVAKAFKEKAPKLLWPALDSLGGWARLQRFAASTQYPTLQIAEKQLAARTLTSQKLRLEADFGFKLFVTAKRGRPMQLTEDGRKVLAAIREMQATTHMPSGSASSSQGLSSASGASRKAHHHKPHR